MIASRNLANTAPISGAGGGVRCGWLMSSGGGDGFQDHETDRWWPLDLAAPKLLLPSESRAAEAFALAAGRFYSDRHPTEIPGRFTYALWPDHDKSSTARAAEALERPMNGAYLPPPVGEGGRYEVSEGRLPPRPSCSTPAPRPAIVEAAATFLVLGLTQVRAKPVRLIT